jgi:hypothetical protein
MNTKEAISNWQLAISFSSISFLAKHDMQSLRELSFGVSSRKARANCWLLAASV